MAAAVRGAKQRLRAELKQRLRALSAEERRRQSHLLTQKVLAHPQYQRARRVSIFLSMPDEVDTAAIVHDIFQQGKVCFIPRYQRGSSHMDMVQLASPEELAVLPRTSWNILQPGEEEVREEALSTGSVQRRFQWKERRVRPWTFQELRDLQGAGLGSMLEPKNEISVGKSVWVQRTRHPTLLRTSVFWPLFFKAQVPEKQKSVWEIPNPEGPGTWGKWELPRLQFSKQAWQLTLPTWPQGHPEHSMVPMKTKLDRLWTALPTNCVHYGWTSKTQHCSPWEAP